MAKVLKTVRMAAVAVGAVAVLAWVVADIAIRAAASGRVYTAATVEAMPPMRAAVVLGCARKLRDGRGNVYYWNRIRAAADLYAQGKVRAIVVSGDNHVTGYDEPTDMKEDLVAQGVPAEKIVCDYAGFRTLDSVVRARKVFGLGSFLIVSQPFHVRRALFLAQGFGCDAYGYAADDVAGQASVKTRVREQFAKVAALLDVALRRRPKFLGPLEAVPE